LDRRIREQNDRYNHHARQPRQRWLAAIADADWETIAKSPPEIQQILVPPSAITMADIGILVILEKDVN
jgi:hypothetical protein